MKATIFQTEDIVKAVEMTTGQDAILYVRNDMRNPLSMWFYREGIALQFQMIGDHKWILHMYGVSGDKLRNLRDWIIKVSSYLMDNTECTCILVFCKESDMRLRFLIKATGHDEGMRIPNGNGKEDEILYVYNKNDREIYERRIRCHKQYQQ